MLYHSLAITALLSIIMTVAPMTAKASGFQLFEQGGALNGQAYVGAAAIADDATTQFYNPAGLVRLQHPQFVWSGVYATVDMEYNGSSTFPGVPPLLPGLPTETGKTQGGKEVIIPSAYYSHPINEDWHFAFGVWSPFGLATDYSSHSLVRYSATRTSLEILDFSPALAYRFNPHFSIGGAINVQYAKVHFDSMFPTTVLGAPAGSPDAKVTNEGDDWALGWHGGILYQFTPATRVGLTYHSKTKHHFSGDSEFASTIPGIGVIRSNNLSASLTLPSYTSLGFYHDFNPRFAAMANVDYTHWSTVGTITLKNVAFPTGPINSGFTQNYHNTWRYGVAGHFHVNPQWMWRAGLAYDQTPTTQKNRSIRLPDGDRFIVAIGTQWRINPEVRVDVGYMHMFIQDGKLRNVRELGKSDNSADLVGMQLTWDMV